MLYAYETWSLTLREECRPRVVENRILRRIFGSKRDENGEWRRFHNEELHNLYGSPNIARVIKSRRIRWADYLARIIKDISSFKILTGKPRWSRGQHMWLLIVRSRVRSLELPEILNMD